MHVLFYSCFGIGVGYTLLSFLLGELAGGADADFLGNASPVKPVAVAAFLTVFGAVGILLTGHVHVGGVISLSGFVGMGAAYMLMRFVVEPLHKAQNTSAVEQSGFIGLVADVTEAIPQGAYGKIVYHAAGNTHSAPAKSIDGAPISRHAKVEIIYIENNTYYVREEALGQRRSTECRSIQQQ